MRAVYVDIRNQLSIPRDATQSAVLIRQDIHLRP